MALVPAPQQLVQTQIHVGQTEILVEVADTPAARERGLSGRASIEGTSLRQGSGASKGMLFIFDSDDSWGIWMKDMRFPIDIIWADAQGTVLTVLPEVSPDTYPQTFYPAQPARYVLEVPAGFAEAHNIAKGSLLVL